MHRALRQTTRFATPSLRRTYAGIKQDDPSLHPTGANSEAAKDLGPLSKSQPAPGSEQPSKTQPGTESNATVQDQQKQQQQGQQPQSQQKNGQQQRQMSTSRPKTIAEQDEELRQRMSGHAGDGGQAGVEYEGGEPVAMKRSVRNNMFRLI
ncbi:uncharacterized protein LTR77_008915 [Saxophila tyrrhenica]|uniref:Uncharacterized protein n=1 Tax=Saxophila tyrrhenica TaxID=1690608 RepID=A0AAV9NZ11_9PEZI|nr:hypothetical protein LTR77_008915 [Saxophila tyrrhenica]